MSRMQKRAITLLLSLVIIASLFAGCAQNGGSQKDPTNKPDKVDTADISIPYTGEEVVFQGYAADLGIKQNAEAPVTKAYFENVGNVRIEWQTAPWQDYGEKVLAFLATGDLPDIIWRGDLKNAVFNYGPAGMFLDWDEYKEYMPNYQGYASKYPSLNYLLTAEGERFVINDIEPFDVAQESWYYNKTMLDDHGIEAPETLDDMMDAMRKIKEEDPAVVPFQTYWNLGYTKRIMAQLLEANTSPVFFNKGTGKWEFLLTSADSNYKELIDLLATMYKEGLINSEIATMSWEQESTAIASNKWAFTYLYSVALENEIYKTTDLPIDIKPMLPPAHNGKRNISLTVTHDGMPGWGYIASAKTKHPELLAAYIDNVVSTKTSELFNWGIEGESFTKDENGNRKFTPEYLEDTSKLADLGVGDLFDPRYIHLKDRMSEVERQGPLGQASHFLNNDALKDGTVNPWYLQPAPLFTDAENQEITEIMSAINTYIEENEARFILGSKDLGEWDSFVEEANAMGNIERVLEIYNSARQVELSENRIYSAE